MRPTSGFGLILGFLGRHFGDFVRHCAAMSQGPATGLTGGDLDLEADARLWVLPLALA